MVNFMNFLLKTGNGGGRCLFLNDDHGAERTVQKGGAGEKPSMDDGTSSFEPQDTILVQDVSYSMEATDCLPSRLDASKAAAHEYVRCRAQISPNDRVAIVAFGSVARIVMPFTPIGDIESITGAIRDLQLDFGTDIAAGLSAAAKLSGQCRYSDNRICRVPLLTDGHGGKPLHIAKKLKNSGAIIEVIGVGGDPSDVNESLLRKVATTDSQGVTHYQFIGDSETLINHYRQMASSIIWKENNP